MGMKSSQVLHRVSDMACLQVWHWASVWSMAIPWPRKLRSTWTVMVQQHILLGHRRRKMTRSMKERSQ